MLALTFKNASDYDLIREDDALAIRGFDKLRSRCFFELEVNHTDGSTDTIALNHSFNEGQIAWFKAGSALNAMKN